MIQSMIFDLAGTLVDRSVICEKMLSDILRDRGSVRTLTSDAAVLSHTMDDAPSVGSFRRGHAEAGSDRSLLIQFSQFADLAAHVPSARRAYRARCCAA